MTLAKMRDLFYLSLRDEGKTLVPPGVVNEWLNQALRIFAQESEALKGYTSTTTTTAREYTLNPTSTEIIRVLRVDYDGEELEPIHKMDLDFGDLPSSVKYWYRAIDTDGVEVLGIAGAPTSGKTLEWWFTKYNKTLSLDADTPAAPIDPSYHPSFVFYSLARFMEILPAHAGRPSEWWERKWLQGLREGVLATQKMQRRRNPYVPARFLPGNLTHRI